MTAGRRQPFIRHRIIGGIRPRPKPFPAGYLAVSGCLRSSDAKTAAHAGCGRPWRVRWHHVPGRRGNRMETHLSTVLVSFIQISWSPEPERDGSGLRQRWIAVKMEITTQKTNIVRPRGLHSLITPRCWAAENCALIGCAPRLHRTRRTGARRGGSDRDCNGLFHASTPSFLCAVQYPRFPEVDDDASGPNGRPKVKRSPKASGVANPVTQAGDAGALGMSGSERPAWERRQRGCPGHGCQHP